MQINTDTKIAALLKHQPQALEAIVQLSPRFEKLRNPLLRKLMASRTTIGMAAKAGGCSVQDFYRQLQPLGFEATADTEEENKAAPQPAPPFMQTLDSSKLTVLDVRPVLASGKDPLNQILQHTKALPPQHTLKIVNSFEPTPLIQLLRQRGFETFTTVEEGGVVATFFFKKSAAAPVIEPAPAATDWEAEYTRYQNNLQAIDVRSLPMPGPMHAVLEALEQLPEGKALFVYHKRVPLFLLPELAAKGFDVRIKEVSAGEVHLLIFKD